MSSAVHIDESPATPDVDLTGKAILVTGGSRGVGAETVRIAAERGADVAINYRSKARRAEQIAESVRGAGRQAAIVEADITDGASVDAMYDTVREAFGRLDVLILNASGGLEKDVDEGYAMRLNRDAQVALVRKALPLMARGGTVVFVTSHLAHYHGEKPVMPEYEPVAASKKAGEVELRALQPDLEAAGIRFVVVSGDLIDGTITPKLLNRMRPGVIDQRREEAGWLPTTEDFAKAIVLAAGKDDLPQGTTIYVGSTEW
ncbi:MAG TPA: SDR family oxidoreductase [Thermomicrobiales bacterium]|nr:SDR family oxidoreductase [Thermomicrobiales bacterium]